MTITKQTAMDIALAHREIDTAKDLLEEITEALSRRIEPDIRDAFGRIRGGLELGVPSGHDGRRLFNVPWPLAKPIIEAHIAQQQAVVAALSEIARIEIEAASAAGEIA